VYGANASGKTNLVSAIEFLRNFWFQYLENKDQPTGAIPFLLASETPNQPSEFSIGFYISQKKYIYNLTVSNNVVLNEKLLIYPSQQLATVYHKSHLIPRELN
jgi:AAA15 family ATPase/GTPase